MEPYLVDQAVLGDFVDGLISEKYPNDDAAKYAELKKDAIRALDYQILKAILASLTKEQGAKLSALLDDEDADSTVFETFFKQNQIDLEAILENTMVQFRNDFLKGGQNG